jgi:hypothetical protein
MSRGKRHDYLGMDLNFTVKREVQVTMIPFLKGVITDFPEEITGIATLPAAAHLFDVRGGGEDRVLL